MTSIPTDTDVVIVGNGPIGATLSVLLAQRDVRVTVLERRARPYRMPRATSFDGETARLLAGTGIGGDLGRITEPANGYQWRTAQGTTLLDIEFDTAGRYGWPDANTMHQPALEELIAARAASLANLTVLRGHEVVGIADHADRIEVRVEGEDAAGTIGARWVVGCDGANSFVRDRIDVSVTDLGFAYEWLLCDVELHEPREFTPTNVQICDPARPTTLVGSGPGHRRWEFMRLPGESAAELTKEETAWRLLEPFAVTPKTARLLRSTTYIFQARWADRWRVGHVLLAGDAAHLMPPFAGQGMCSGIRDAANLAWKLDLVMRGAAPEALLDTYGEERRAAAEQAILASVQLGRLICVTDPAAAAERDATVLAGRRGRGPSRPEPAKPLTTGLRRGSSAAGPSTTGFSTAGSSTAAGAVVPQGRVTRAGRTGLFDDVVGRGFVLLLTGDDQYFALDEAQRAFLADLGTHVVCLTPRDVVDVDDVYLPYLAAFDASALLVRPDYHVFGAGTDLRALIEDLRAQLCAPVSAL